MPPGPTSRPNLPTWADVLGLAEEIHFMGAVMATDPVEAVAASRCHALRGRLFSDHRGGGPARRPDQSDRVADQIHDIRRARHARGRYPKGAHLMPGSPPVTPNMGLPRFSQADDADYSDQTNAVADAVDVKGALVTDPRLTDQRTPASRRFQSQRPSSPQRQSRPQRWRRAPSQLPLSPPERSSQPHWQTRRSPMPRSPTRGSRPTPMRSRA